MQNILLIFSCIWFLFFAWAYEGNEFYNIKFKSLEGDSVKMVAFKGKQILLFEFNVNNIDKISLHSLDSIYMGRKTQLEVIAIPVKDFNNATVTGSLSSLLRDSLKLHYTIANVSYAKRIMGNEQHPLLQWATSKNFNLHFDDDVRVDGEIFIFSQTGELYAKLDKIFLEDTLLIQNVLNNQPHLN